MNINPYILLGIGSTFALLYAAVIIIGWARTRRNRREIRTKMGISEVPTVLLDKSIENAPETVRTFSLENNVFEDNSGKPIDIHDYRIYVAVGTSPEYPDISNGNLLFMDTDGIIRYVFELPDIELFR